MSHALERLRRLVHVPETCPFCGSTDVDTTTSTPDGRITIEHCSAAACTDAAQARIAAILAERDELDEPDEHVVVVVEVVDGPPLVVGPFPSRAAADEVVAALFATFDVAIVPLVTADHVDDLRAELDAG